MKRLLILFIFVPAVAFAARSTNVTTSIYAGGKAATNVSVHAVDWSTDNGTISLSNTVPSVVVAGDIYTDAAGNSYLITASATTNLTAQDFDAQADPVTGTGSIVSAYSTITLWEASLDSTNLYAANDAAVGECYDDSGDFDESVTLNGGDTIGLVAATISVAAGERHDGTAGSGARIVRADITGFILKIVAASSGPLLSCDWLEIDADGGRSDPMVTLQGNASTSVRLSKMLIHSSSNTFGNDMIGLLFSVSGCHVMNCIIYDITHGNTGAHDLLGISAPTSATRTDTLLNSTVYGVTKNGSSGNAYGINLFDATYYTNQNCIAMAVSGGAAAVDWNQTAYTNAVVSYNMSEDATASGTGSLVSRVAANQFVSVAGGSEDFHLKAGANAHNAGADLGTTPTGINLDIDGTDRDARSDPWDIGCHEWPYRRRIILSR